MSYLSSINAKRYQVANRWQITVFEFMNNQNRKTIAVVNEMIVVSGLKEAPFNVLLNRVAIKDV